MDEKELLARIEKLERENRRAKDYIEISNLFGRYMYLHTAEKHKECADLFAKNAQDVSLEFHSCGVFDGPEGVKKMYVDNMGKMPKRTGTLFEHGAVMPVIEVAGDGKTAKGLWLSVGHETRPEKEGSLSANWMWGKYGVDFIKEDGKWKIWHYQVFMTFMCPYDKPWTDPEVQARKTPRIPNSDRETTYYNAYNKDFRPENWPAAPEPYDTFENTWSMVGAPPEGFDI